MTEIILGCIAFTTSMTTAIFGLGGGLLLIACMPGFVPATSIIPVHSAVQLASNMSRAGFGFSSIRWDYTSAFFIGSIIGGILAAKVTTFINLEYVPLFIAAFILWNVWGPGMKLRSGFKGEFLAVGFVQTGLGLLIGATGPLGQAGLLRHGLKRDPLVVTVALFMTITHIVKITMFGLLGFSFIAHGWLIGVMILGSVAGSWVGTRLRSRIPEIRFSQILKWLMTALALRILYVTFA